MRPSLILRTFSFLLVGAALSSPASGQITTTNGDGVLNAPYRGTIESLRSATWDAAYGEVRTWIEPENDPWNITSTNIQVWRISEWDRSVFRLLQDLDASGDEIDLTNTSSMSPANVPKGANTFKRFSLKSIGTKSLAPKEIKFHVKYNYSSSGGPGMVNEDRTFYVAPTTGSFHQLPGLSEAFHFGTPILDVSAGAARLGVPIGRKGEMIGAAFTYHDTDIGNKGAPGVPDTDSLIPSTESVLPWAGESIWIQNGDQFRTFDYQYGANKPRYGTPWIGYLLGLYAVPDAHFPGAFRYKSDASSGTIGVRKVNFIRYWTQDEPHPAVQKYVYDSNNRVIEIRDQATPANVITLTRVMGVVQRVSTSDGRGWNMSSDAMSGWVTAILPDGPGGPGTGPGKRSFTRNSVGRVLTVKDANDGLMYEFTYGADGHTLTSEKRFVDGALQTAIVHEVVDAATERRREFTGTNGEFRQTELQYDTGNLKHRLKKTREWRDVNTNGPFYDTDYTHDVNNARGTMVMTQVSLPDGSSLSYEYDATGDSLPNERFGFRTKTTHTKGASSLRLLDTEYEFLFPPPPETPIQMFHLPRMVKQRDGRHNPPTINTEVTFDYENGGVDENGDGMPGEKTNQLYKCTGPAITLGTSGTRTPETRYTYWQGLNYFKPMLRWVDTDYASGTSRRVEHNYDALLRLSNHVVDPGGKNIVTAYTYADTVSTQDRTVINPDGYQVRTQYDNDGRIKSETRYLTAGGASGPNYTAQYVYDTNGRLQQRIADNKDQAGNSLSPATITTQYTYDQIGRLTQEVLDPAPGIGQQTNYDYNWLGDVERQFDTTGRGFSRTYDGRGLMKTEFPLAQGQAPDSNLTVTHDYDSVGRHLTQTSPTGTKFDTVYDDFGRVNQSKRVPIAGQGMFDIISAFEYDQASNVTRTSISENGMYLSDTTALFDEGGFNYETRQRLAAGTDGSSDPLMQRKFDWAGNVTEDRWLGDATVGDRVVVSNYDSANRLESMSDSTSGFTLYARDQRGNITEQRVKLKDNPLDQAITTTVFDALSRPTQVTEPEDQFSLRPDRTMEYDSRSNLLRELRRDSGDVPKMQTRASFDAAGRQTQVAIMANASQTGGSPILTTDRVTNFEYDADGRLLFRKSYNNNSSTALTTATIYDALGRVDRVTDPSGSYNEDNYLTNGRLQNRQVYDGISLRTFTIGYDGHDRINSQTAVGPPDLVTTYTLDGLDRTTKVVDPRALATTTTFDLIGRRTVFLEDAEGVGSLQRRTDFTYNRLSQLITQTAQNKNNDGSSPTQQITRSRYDSLGRLRRTVYPDNTTDDTESEIENCTDCERMEYDVAGRMTSHTDQRGTETAYLYEDRGPLISRTAGSDIDSFEYDALGRTKISQRGTAGNPDASARTETSYNDIGDLTQQKQTIAEGTLRTVDYTYDQAGNRTLLAYPGGRNLTGNSTALNQPDQLSLDGSLLVDYTYNGRLLTGRTTNVPNGGSDYYAMAVGYDVHRRINNLVNTVFNGVTTTLAQFGFTHDNDGNILTQTADGVGGFDGDDRTFTIDRLNRVTATDYSGTPADDNSVLDRVGNRQSHTNRAGTATAYTLANLANEYATVGGTAVTYDGVGNLSVDEAGRQYFYDEHDRLKQVKNSGGTVLANYTYDGLGRRVTFNDAVAGTTLRYYYDGAALIEERDASDNLLRYHVNGRQYVDERAATFIPSSGDWKFHLLGNNFSVVGTGEDAGHPNVTRFDFGALGDFVATPPASGTFTMHGQQIDVLSDGLVLMHFRARVYDPKNGRWLQRDPSGYTDGNNLYESFGSNPLANSDPGGRDSITTDASGDLVYINDEWGGNRFMWAFAKPFPSKPHLVVIDHPDWPFAFLLTRATALSEFNTWFYEDDYRHPFDIMREATRLAVQESRGNGRTKTKIIAILDKRDASAGWFGANVALDVSDNKSSNRTDELLRLAHEGLQQKFEGARTFAAVSFSLTTSALAAPTGLGGTIVDVAVAGSDLASEVARGKTPGVTSAVVITAVVGGAALHLRFADEAVTTGALRGRITGDPGVLRNKVGLARAGNAAIDAEIRVAKLLRSQGKNVHFIAEGTGKTPDFLIDGLRVDVYSPTTTNADNIISEIAKKNKQAEIVYLDLSRTTVTPSELGDIVRRVQGAGATNIVEVVILEAP